MEIESIQEIIKEFGTYGVTNYVYEIALIKIREDEADCHRRFKVFANS